MRRELQMKAFRPTLLAAVMTALMAGAPALADTADKLDRVKVDLVAPPMVHAHEQKATSGPTVVQVRKNIEEKKIVIDDKGNTMQAMTIKGLLPGTTTGVHDG